MGFLIFFLVACQEAVSENLKPILPSPTPTSLSPGIQNTATVIPNTSFVTENCLPVQQNMGASFLTSGNLLFQKRTEGQHGNLWSLSNRAEKPIIILTKENLSSVVLSSSGKWLAFHVWGSVDEFQIMNSFSDETITRAWKTQWQNGLGLRWLDDSWLVVPSVESPFGELTLL
ncbi:MAG: hypothetical protein DWQ04_01605 [Chloroflexi bacterium]|nr:MAG: hypothetical protein DWQ04_01605 [Chloroflexota bacterium]